LAFSYWIDYLGFTAEGRLAAMLIIPSLGVPNWSVIYSGGAAPGATGVVAPARLLHYNEYYTIISCVLRLQT
jgi:hypothetical protein